MPFPGYSSRNPTLVPNFDPQEVIRGTISNVDISDYLVQNPRAPSNGSITVAGTITTGDVLTINVTNAVLPNGKISVTVPVPASATLNELAQLIANALNGNATFNQYGMYAEVPSGGTAVDIVWPGPIGNFSILSASSSGTETFSEVQMSGGAGPIIPVNNFEFAFNGSTQAFWMGKPTTVDYALLTVLVKQGMPIY